MSSFSTTELSLGGLKVIERSIIEDERGFLSRLFCLEELKAIGWSSSVQQINYTHTKRAGTVRGMHFQYPPRAEMKLVSCLQGEIWDVAIDLRVNSPTYLAWHAEYLSEKNKRSLLIPEGFAHGFQAVTDSVYLLYCHSNLYSKELEYGLNPVDPMIGIDWPHEITEISIRDKNFPFIDSSFRGVQL